jgi:ATP-dependent DNA helicase RecG
MRKAKTEMIDESELRRLLADLESDRIERTTSASNTDKLCEAICAFANDMPANNCPGYLVIGAGNDGAVVGLEVQDQVLQQLSNYADSGQIVPLPSMTVQKMSLAEGEVIVVEVRPSDMPPIRYRGRVWIRRGPRKAIANEQEERILTEKRTHHARTFDLRPCRGCGSEDLALDLFHLTYRNAALAPELIAENNRDLFLQMASLGFWCMAEQCATNAGAILFAQDPLNWFPGATIQYVRYEGDALDADALDERRFDGDLITVLRELDGFLRTLFPSQPESVSPLKEEIRTPYPMLAVRELLMNAVMHRDYESNAPVRFYWFSDHIEIQNAGGLYGAVTPQTFPNQNDYRNPKIAEAMKTLGYVNTFGRGIARTQRLLSENGNPPAEFGISEPTFFLASVRKAVK